MKIHLDGKLVDRDDAKVSVFDHGLLYGDGVFEGIRFYNGRIFRCEEHIDRLWDSAQSILMELPWSREEVTQAMVETIRANELHDGYVRLVVTRGEGSLGLSPFTCPRPSLIIIAAAIQLYPEEYYEQGLTVVTCGTRRTSAAALSPAVKSLNYLNNIMAKIEALNAGAQEGLMLNEQGYIAECTGDNVFSVKNGIISTPPVSAGSLDGITRKAVLEITAELGLPLVERQMIRHDLYVADEVFLTGTAAEVVPVTTLDRRKIGAGVTGPLTRQIMERFHDIARSTGYPIYTDQ